VRAARGNSAEGDREKSALRERVRQQESVGRLAFSALSGIGLEELFERAVSEVSRVLGVEFCKVLELLPDGDRLALRAGVGWSGGLVGEASVGSGLESQAGYTLISSEPVVVKNLSSERRFSGPLLLLDHGVKSGVSATIRAGGRSYGVLGAHTGAARSFGEDEASYVQNVADLLGAAIERRAAEGDVESLLGERTARARKAEQRFEFLTRANAALSASTRLDTILRTALHLAVPAVADWCFVDVVSERDATVERLAVAQAASPAPGSEELAASPESCYAFAPDAPHGTPRVLRTGAPELVPEVTDEVLRGISTSSRELAALRELLASSYLCVPLRVGGRMLGSVGFVAGDRARYGEEDLLLAEGLAHSTAIALDNARHHEDEAELARRLYELATTEKQLVPAANERSPEAPGLTGRQMQILELLAEGYGVGEICQKLYLSKATVRNHIRALLQALGAHSQLEAVARARKLGLISG
jgi:GAF domain-containing protein/DNA-binding CsgD family transcriptional regulator